jgi:FtsH-binding integral membrane protein
MNNSFDHRYQGTAYGPITTTNTFVQNVFMIMAIGLTLTGVTAYAFADMILNNPAQYGYLVFGPMRWVIIFAPVAIVLILSGMINTLSYAAATVAFGLYAVANGLSLSFIFFVYSLGSIASCFFIAAGMFGAMAIYGMTTKTNLNSWGSYLFMALIGIIIASLVNLFLQSPGFSYFIAFITVIVFAGLTAYDMQNIMQIGMGVDSDTEEVRKSAIIGALALYLDFINIFLALLRLFGSSRD